MEVIVTRHGLTALNKEERLNGRLDEELAAEGHEEALALAHRLKDKGIDAIYSSPLVRAVQTATPLSEMIGVPITPDERLIEVDFGDLTGKTQEEVAEILGSTMVEQLNSYSYDLSKFNGESNGQVYDRVHDFTSDMKKQEKKVVLIVAHGGIVRMLNYDLAGEKIGLPPNAHEFKFTV